MKEKQSVIGCRVSETEKTEIDRIVDSFGMSRSDYLHTLLFKHNNKLQQAIQLPSDLIIDPSYIDEISATLLQLRAKHPKHSASAIIQGALKIALENEKRIISNKLKEHLA